MTTPVNKPSPVKTPIPQETIGRAPSADQPTAEQLKILPLDLLFPQNFGQYRVLKLLGKGGMGSVYMAEDPVLQRKVAIKTLRPELAVNAVSKQRFLREARIVSCLKHEHIVTIYNVGEENGIPYLAMEYLEGHSLETWIQKNKKLTWAQIIRLGREIARALSVAHAKNLIHRDIKPGNIWLECLDKKTGKTRVKILDFGLARYVQQEGGPTVDGMVVGTPHYVSPEQARGKDLDPRSDLFSLGVVLYRLCTRRCPFDGTDTLALLTSLAMDDPRPMRELNPDIPEAFDQFVMKLLEKSPDNRPGSAQEVADTLQTIYFAEQKRSSTGIPGVRPDLHQRSLSQVPLEPRDTPVIAPLAHNKVVILLCGLIAFFSLLLITLICIKLLSS